MSNQPSALAPAAQKVCVGPPAPFILGNIGKR